MCPAEFKLKKVNIREDLYSSDIADKSDTLDISGYFQTIDLQYLFSAIRKSGGKFDSLKLGDILLQELGEGLSKWEFEGFIQEAPYIDFENFLLYSAFDSYRLNQLEAQNNDVNLIHNMAKISDTRHSKVMRKTTSIRNLAAKTFLKKNMVLSNNQNMFKEHEDLGKFKGAFVASSTKIHKIGIEMNGERSTTAFDDTVDEDFTSLYPSIIRCYQIGDVPLIGKILFKNSEYLNEYFCELLNERDMNIIGNKVFSLPTFSHTLENLDSILKDEYLS